MRKSKLDNPHIKQQVVKRLAVGECSASIAKDVGLHRSQIYRFTKREDVKALIEQEQLKLLEVVPDAVENVKELVRGMKKIPKSDIRGRELAYKATHDTLKSVGIMPTPVQSQVITSFYQQTNIMANPLVEELLEKHLERLAKGPEGIETADNLDDRHNS